MQQESQHNNWERIVAIIPKKNKTKGHLSIELSGLLKSGFSILFDLLLFLKA